MTWLISNALMQDYENSPSSPGLVEEYSAASCLDGEPSAPLSGNLIPQAFCAPDKMTAFSRLSRFGMTFKPLTESRGKALLTLYLAGFPARTSVLRGGGQALLEAEVPCGNTWQGLLGRYDPSTHSLKTAQCSLFEDLKPSSVTLPRWGSMQDGELYQRQTLVRPTSENESGSEPNNETFFHTPTTGGLDGGSNSRKALKKRMENWPTPVASMHKGSSPAALTRKSGASRENDRLDHAVMAADAGQLNPDWVEWMMNWPIGWTSLEPLSHKQFKYWQESSAAHLHSNGMREMWFDIDPATAPQGQEPDEQRPGECGGALSDLPQGGSHDGWDMGQGQGGTGYLQSLQFGIPADTIKACDGLRPGMPEGMGANLRKSPLGFVPRTGAGIMSRSDRLRAIGNGQVPIVAATAWEILKGEFDG